ncbi:MAG TPA: LysM peptidoglycan-binding domain-containing protein [Bacteroidales bacterium]|nr:LysM peptidoglycan-binding domain-containing protein [Bacteroidales bacterium]HRZ49023.1 LysM peptidoglycan-binding domain-containing protein [Bacteroidales bacterium]
MRRLLIFFLTLLTGFPVFAQLTAYRNKVPGGYNFWVHKPVLKTDSLQEPLPVILFLHGASLTGSNLERVRRYGVLDAIEKGKYIPALVVAPQSPKGTPWNPDRIVKVLDFVQQKYNTDTNRVYVVGMSLGGYGTMDFVGTYPHRVAAAAALCGGGSPKLACNLGQVPLWIMHGTADNAVPLSESQKMVDAIAACGDTSRLIFTKYPGYGHGGLARVFYADDFYVWLLSHDRCDTARPVVRSLPLPPSALKNVYRNASPQNLQVTWETGNDTLPENIVPEKTQTAPPKSSKNAVYHTVKKGDTLYAIARKNHTTVDKLCRLNGIKETKVLQLGMKIRVR